MGGEIYSFFESLLIKIFNQLPYRFPEFEQNLFQQSDSLQIHLFRKGFV